MSGNVYLFLVVTPLSPHLLYFHFFILAFFSDFSLHNKDIVSITKPPKAIFLCPTGGDGGMMMMVNVVVLMENCCGYDFQRLVFIDQCMMRMSRSDYNRDS